MIHRMLDDIVALNQTEYDPASLADDGAIWTDKFVEKPWGHEVELYWNKSVSITRLTIRPGMETSMHCHIGKDVTFVVEVGECVLDSLSGAMQMKAGEQVQIQRGAFHRARTTKGCVLLEVESPANKRDIVRLADRYGRGQGYAPR